MIVIQHKDIDKLAAPYFNQAQALVNSAKPVLVERYCSGDEESYSHSTSVERNYRDLIELKLRYGLEELLALLKENLKDALILDIGCGAKNSTDRAENTPENLYEPWLCRLLHHLGCNVVGIDIMDNETEPFESHRVDLVNGGLDFLMGRNFDIATESNFLISPLLEKALGGFSQVSAFRERLIRELDLIVRPEGYFVNTVD